MSADAARPPDAAGPGQPRGHAPQAARGAHGARAIAALPVNLVGVRTLHRRSGARLPLLRAGGRRAVAWIWKRRLLAAEVLGAWLLVSQSWYGQPSQPGVGGVRRVGPAAALALILALVLPLLWRRKAPAAIFAAVFAVALVQAVFTPDDTDDLALLVAFYTVADREPLRRVLAAALALEAGNVFLAVILYRTPGVDAEHAGLVWAEFSVLVAVTGLLGYYTRGRRAYLKRERERNAELAAAAERTRIAREMHDIVAHNIAVMIALADGASYTIARDPGQAAVMVGHVSQTGRSALTEMRRLLGILRQADDSPSHSAPQPHLADLDTMITAVRQTGLPVRLTVSGQPFPLPPSAQLTLYRIVQEALTNTIKHADAASAHVHLSYAGEEVGLDVTDDGRAGRLATAGPPGAAAAAPGCGTAGHGLAGMRERAAVFGGEVFAGPLPEGGWRVHTQLHISAARADTPQASA